MPCCSGKRSGYAGFDGRFLYDCAVAVHLARVCRTGPRNTRLESLQMKAPPFRTALCHPTTLNSAPAGAADQVLQRLLHPWIVEPA